ncbi:MAG: MmgE/PrpD family protein, partial [Hyphomicrobiales bacterium]|nr:MmgE/PrpD family protein [Hyphomicrobiales bacterium]
MLAPLTMERLLALSAIPGCDISEGARAMARMSLFDWLTVSRAGSDQPLARIMRDFVAAEGGEPAATVAGLAQRVPARAAALANGTIS